MSIERPIAPTYSVILAASLRKRAGEPGPRGWRMFLWVPDRPSGPSGMTILKRSGTRNNQSFLPGGLPRYE